MTDDKLTAAVEVLVGQLQEQAKQMADTKSTINSLLRRMGKEPMFEDANPEMVGGTIRADMFYGKPLSTAAQMFLQQRGQACKADDILKGLEQGGFDFKSLNWKDQGDRLRNLAISMAKNTKVFHRLPNGTFGLLSQYPEVVKAESAAKKTTTKKPGPKKAASKIAPKKAVKAEVKVLKKTPAPAPTSAEPKVAAATA